MRSATKVMLWISGGCAIICWLFMIACIALPPFFKDGTARARSRNSFLAEREVVKSFGRGGATIQRLTELAYTIEITDQAGRPVAYDYWNRLPKEEGEAMKYLPFFPEINLKAEHYHYVLALLIGFAAGLVGTVPFLLVWDYANKERTSSTSPHPAQLARGSS